jgi:ABC-type lipoprotein export system ATPase subunit
MPISQQKTRYLKIDRLKGLRNLDEIRLDEKPLTALLGVNGSGKSTILHALACCYKPIANSEQKDWKFSNFFTPTSHDTWKGSHITMYHSYREGANEFLDAETIYQKSTDRWAPQYSRRQERHVIFVGIKSCLPKIEEETAVSAIKFDTNTHLDSSLIMEKMSYVFNRQYQELNTHAATKGRLYSGLALDGVNYSSLAMGAGEQRAIEILSAVFNAPKYGLILIDEIDLLLHTHALNRIISVISKRAEDKGLQIVFTSHRETILARTDEVSIKHLHSVKVENTGKRKTLCFSNTTADALYRLTGEMERSLEIFVEDEVAKAIVDHEAFKLKLKRHTNTVLYGSASNCFTVLGGLALTNKYDPARQLYVLDGDVLASANDRQRQIEKVVSGTESGRVEFRQDCVSGIRQFAPSEHASPSPEAQIHWMIQSLNPHDLEDMQREIYDIAISVRVEQDTHDLVGMILKILNEGKDSGISKIVSLAALSDYWPTYVAQVREWLIVVMPSVLPGETISVTSE